MNLSGRSIVEKGLRRIRAALNLLELRIFVFKRENVYRPPFSCLSWSRTQWERMETADLIRNNPRNRNGWMRKYEYFRLGNVAVFPCSQHSTYNLHLFHSAALKRNSVEPPRTWFLDENNWFDLHHTLMCLWKRTFITVAVDAILSHECPEYSFNGQL